MHFVSPYVKKLNKLKKDYIVQIKNRLELGVRKFMRKTQQVKIVVEYTINNIFDEEALYRLSVHAPELSQAHLKLEKAKIKANAKVKVEIEKARIEQEIRFPELEERRELHDARRSEFDLALFDVCFSSKPLCF